eukprot:COSAG02_NODE_4859_length_4896_cov_3.244945_2_plen_70_part_00
MTVSLAQWIAHQTSNLGVAGSSPAWDICFAFRLSFSPRVGYDILSFASFSPRVGYLFCFPPLVLPPRGI